MAGERARDPQHRKVCEDGRSGFVKEGGRPWRKSCGDRIIHGVLGGAAPPNVHPQQAEFARLYPLDQKDMAPARRPIDFGVPIPAGVEVEISARDYTPPQYLTLLLTDLEQVPQVLEVDVESALMGHGGCRHHVSRARQQREWFHIGGFLMDTSKLALPPWMPVLDDGPEMSIGVIGSCLLTNVRSGIWIVGRTTLS